MMKKTHPPGFALIELCGTVAVVATIAAFTFPVFAGAHNSVPRLGTTPLAATSTSARSNTLRLAAFSPSGDIIVSVPASRLAPASTWTFRSGFTVPSSGSLTFQLQQSAGTQTDFVVQVDSGGWSGTAEVSFASVPPTGTTVVFAGGSKPTETSNSVLAVLGMPVSQWYVGTQ